MFALKVALDYNGKEATVRLLENVNRGARQALKKNSALVVQAAKALIMTKGQQEKERKRLNPVRRDTKTGRFTSGGATTTGRASTGRSKPGGYPRSDTGNMRKSIKAVERGKIAFVGPTWPKGAHAGLLKWGSKWMKPRLVPAEGGLRAVKDRLVTNYSSLF